MFSVAAPIWNEVAKMGGLQSPMMKRLMPLNQTKLNAALERETKRLTGLGYPNRVALACLTVGPLLWERNAIAAFKKKNPTMGIALPEVLDQGEALILATKEFRLSAPQQTRLGNLLRHPM